MCRQTFHQGKGITWIFLGIPKLLQALVLLILWCGLSHTRLCEPIFIVKSGSMVLVRNAVGVVGWYIWKCEEIDFLIFIVAQYIASPYPDGKQRRVHVAITTDVTLRHHIEWYRNNDSRDAEGVFLEGDTYCRKKETYETEYISFWWTSIPIMMDKH